MSQSIQEPATKIQNSYWLKPVSPVLTYAFIVWAVFWAIAILKTYVVGFFLLSSNPYNSPFPAAETRFGDFFGTFSDWVVAQGLGGVGYGVSYFPATYMPIHLLTRLAPNPWDALPWSQAVWFLSIPIIMWGLRNKGFLTSFLVTLIVFLSYPSLFILHTANLEGWVGAGILLAALMFYKKNYVVFALLLGTVGSLKGIPMIFLAALIPFVPWRKIFLYSGIALLTALFLNVIALTVLPGGYRTDGLDGVIHALDGLKKSQAMYIELMVNGGAGNHFGHSLLNTIHTIWGGEFLKSSEWGNVFSVSGIALLGLVFLAIKIKKIHFPEWAAFLIIGCAACLFTATSTDYKLVYLFPALLLFFKEENEGNPWIPTMILFMFVISPKPWLRISTDPWSTAMVYLTTMGLLALPLIYFSTIWRTKRSSYSMER